MSASDSKRLADGLERLPSSAAWGILVGACWCLHTLDLSFPGIGMGPLYIPVIAFAFWRLGNKAGLLVLAAAVALNAVAMLRDGEAGPSGILIARGLTRLSAYGFTALTIRFARRAYEGQRTLARTDGLTGSANRQSFNSEFADALCRAKPRNSTLLLAVFDVDNFKKVNDLHGHESGDRLLVAIAQGASIQLRRGDCVGRLGGDEFALFLVLPSAVDAQQLASDLHQRLQGVVRSLSPIASLSIGMVIVPPDAERQVDQLLRRADQLLYDAKRSGKGRFKCFRLESPNISMTTSPAIAASKSMPVATFCAMPVALNNSGYTVSLKSLRTAIRAPAA